MSGAPAEDAPAQGSGVPRFRAICETLAGQIAAGELPVGSRLPSEQELCLRFGASRHTVREALRLLQEQGLVTRRQGAGTTVIAREASDGFANSVTTLDGLVQYASSTALEVLTVETLLTDDRLAGLLRAAPSEAWTRICALRRSTTDGGLLCYSEIFLPAEFAGLADRVGRTRTAVYTMLEEAYDIRIAEVSQLVEAAAADANIASRLGLAPGDPVLLITRHYTDQEGRTVEVARNAHPAGRFAYRMVLQRG